MNYDLDTLTPLSTSDHNLLAAIDGAEETAVQRVESTPPSKTPLAQDHRRKAHLEQNIAESTARIQARRQLFNPWNAELEALERADKTMLDQYESWLAPITRRLAAAGTALLVAGGLTLGALLSPQSPALHSSPFPPAPHEAGPTTAPPDAKDGSWRGPSFWA